MAAEDLPDDLPAEPVVFWVPDARTKPMDPAHVLQVGTDGVLGATAFSQSSRYTYAWQGNVVDNRNSCYQAIRTYASCLVLSEVHACVDALVHQLHPMGRYCHM